MRTAASPGGFDAAGLAPRWAPDDQFAVLPAALVWLLVGLMTVPEGFDYSQLANPGTPASGSTASRLLWSGLLLGALTLLGQRARLTGLLLRCLNPWLIAFLVLGLASLAWSIDAGLTGRRLVRVATVLAVSLAFVSRGWHERRLQQVLRPLLTLLMAGSLLFGLGWPELAIHQELSPELAGAWRGLNNHKNGLGALACISLLLWWHAGLSGQAGRLRAAAGGALALSCLLLSRSSTAQATSVFVMCFVLLALKAPVGLRRRVPALVAGLLLLIAVYALAMLDIVPGLHTLTAPITALSSKNSTLTGRTEIWAVLTDHILRRPWLGTGYGAFWTASALPGSEAWEVASRLNGFYPGSAHNGYLEITNDLGLAGLACLLGYIGGLRRQMLELWRSGAVQAALYLGLLFQQAISNLSESHWLSVLSLDFLLMTLVTAGLARALLERRLLVAYGQPDTGEPELAADPAGPRRSWRQLPRGVGA
jgi:O-antigen ligase